MPRPFRASRWPLTRPASVARQQIVPPRTETEHASFHEVVFGSQHHRPRAHGGILLGADHRRPPVLRPLRTPLWPALRTNSVLRLLARAADTPTSAPLHHGALAVALDPMLAVVGYGTADGLTECHSVIMSGTSSRSRALSSAVMISVRAFNFGIVSVHVIVSLLVLTSTRISIG